MADKNSEHRSGGVRVKTGVLPGVREIRRPDFTKKAADIEKAEAERVLKQGEANTDAADEAAVRASLEAQESGGEESQLDESAITDEALWYVAHTYSGYENKVKINIEKTIENRHLENQIFEVRVPMQDAVEGSKPVPLTEAEMKSLGIHTGSVTVDFEVGDSVTVVAGIWKDTVGQVQKIDLGKQTTTIKVEMFGSEIPVEISFAEVRKLS